MPSMFKKSSIFIITLFCSTALTLSGCRDSTLTNLPGSSPNTSSTSQQSTSLTDPNLVDDTELKKLGKLNYQAEKLLAPVVEKFKLNYAPHTLGANEVGATEVVSFTDGDIVVEAYIFENGNGHVAAAAKLEAAVADQAAKTLTGGNGNVLFFGYTKLDSKSSAEAAYHRLSEIMTRVGGEE